MKNQMHVWLQSFPGQITCTKYIPPECFSSLPQVYNLIDDYLVDSIYPQILRNACKHGASNDDLKFILKRTFPIWKDVVDSAATGGHLHVFKWMLARQDGRSPWASDFKDVYKKAAACGHLDLIKWLYARGIGKIDNDVANCAARKGHLSVLQWLSENAFVSRHYDALSDAAANGDLEVVQWFYEEFWGDQQRSNNYHFIKTTESARNSAAKSGHLEMLQWLHQQISCDMMHSHNRSRYNTNTMDAAVDGGHLNVVKWLCANCKGSCAYYDANSIPDTGNLPMLQFLYQHFRIRFRSDILHKAAERGHLDVLKWLHKQKFNFFWSIIVMDTAARCGHLDVVRWLHENRDEGCTTNAMKWAAENGHVHVVKWLHENRSEGCGDLSMYGPVKNGHLEVVKWLVEHKPEICRDNLMEVAATEGHLDVACYLDENTKQCSSDWGLGAAAKEGFAKVILLLMQRYSTNGSLPIGRMKDYAEKFCSRLPKEGVRTSSPLWNDVVEMLEIFHINNGFGISTMLVQALQLGNFVMVRQFFERRSEHKKREYLSDAVEKDDVVLLRWLLENEAPLNVRAVATFKHVEAAWWLSERDRVKLVCDALKNDGSEAMLLWVLNNTRFEDESSKHAIRGALKDVIYDSELWLSDKISNDDVRSWCFPSKRDEADIGTIAGRGLKRARGE